MSLRGEHWYVDVNFRQKLIFVGLGMTASIDRPTTPFVGQFHLFLMSSQLRKV